MKRGAGVLELEEGFIEDKTQRAELIRIIDTVSTFFFKFAIRLNPNENPSSSLVQFMEEAKANFKAEYNKILLNKICNPPL